MDELASPLKVMHHKQRVESYLNGDPVYPVTLELDFTARCNRDCPDCPSSLSAASMMLDEAFLERLFGTLAGQTRGLLLTGGEPTLYPEFAKAVAMARAAGFIDINCVTNGSRLHEEDVAEALLQHVSGIRVSLYGWGQGACEAFEETLGRIEMLRSRIDRTGSRLEIGVSALTDADSVSELSGVVSRACDAGAHWAYFHPRCEGWMDGAPARVDQSGVIEEVERIQSACQDGFRVFVQHARYSPAPVRFAGYHAAHFLLVIGADRKNYLAPEVKYHPDYVIASLTNGFTDRFLRHDSRLAHIKSIASESYRPLNSRNRGILYSALIEQLQTDSASLPEAGRQAQDSGFRYPHIL